MSRSSSFRAALVIITSLIVSATSFARSTPSKSTPATKTSTTAKITESPKTRKKMSKRAPRPVVKRAKSRKRKSRYYEHFYTSSFATDNTEGDISAGEDPIVRAAAIDALGNMNGTVVAIDPESGRILAMVNQKLALSEGAQPCSTFKVAVGLAALSEGIITKDTDVLLGRRTKMNLTYALAHSNNAYFEEMAGVLDSKKSATTRSSLDWANSRATTLKASTSAHSQLKSSAKSLGALARCARSGKASRSPRCNWAPWSLQSRTTEIFFTFNTQHRKRK